MKAGGLIPVHRTYRRSQTVTAVGAAYHASAKLLQHIGRHKLDVSVSQRPPNLVDQSKISSVGSRANSLKDDIS